MTTHASTPPARESPHVYYSLTRSLCAVCKTGIDAKILFRDGGVWLDKRCPRHGKQQTLVSSSVAWYLDSLSFRTPQTPPTEVRRPVAAGCPFDCGPCPGHRQRVALPVVPITSACNLDCPICYTVNRNQPAYALSPAALARLLAPVRERDHEPDIINFTGGEPTLHPQLPELLGICRDAGIRLLTISTNGLKLRDEALVERLAALDARIVLSLDSLRDSTDQALLGARTVKTKLRVLELLEQYEVATTILPAVARGYNDDEIGELFELVLRKPNILSLELHPLCFTGQGGASFDRRARITIPDLHAELERHTGGRITGGDFVPSPLAHPHCYSICYLLCLDGGGYVPFTRLASRAVLYELLRDALYLEPREPLETVFRGIIDELWADPGRLPESQAVLRTLKRLLREMFPAEGPRRSLDERKKIAERSAKAIYIHAHMDEESFDVGRVMRCCVAVPEPDGTSIPTCSYNVLYRERDPRFVHHPMVSGWVDRA